MPVKEFENYIERLQSVFHSTMRRVGHELSELLEEGLTVEQFFFLRLLARRGKCTASELAQEFRVKPSAITAMTDRLYKNNFIEREGDKRDRRVVYIGLSAKGDTVLANCEAKQSKILQDYLSNLSSQELKSMVHIFEKIAANVNNTKEE